MNFFKKFLATTLALAASIYAAERVYLAPFSMVGLNEDFGIAAEKLMNAYIDDNGRFILVNYAEDDSVKTGDRESANNIAIKKNCTKFIMAEFTRLGENVITAFKLYDINNEAPVWSDRLKAKNPDDFDPIIQRVARNIGTRHKATNDDDIYTVTEQETKNPRKKGVTSYWGAKIVGALPLNPSEAKMDAGLGAFVLYDARDLLFGFDWTITNLGESYDKTRLIDLTLSAYYPFTTSNITPYAGGGLSYSWRDTRIDTDRFYNSNEANGLSLQIGGGVLFNRASRVMFIAQATYFIDFFETSFYREQYDTVGRITNIIESKHYMNGFKFGLGLAIGF
jgi:opacity protein-like surface antigen